MIPMHSNDGTTQHRARVQRAGFTLVELMIVVAVIGILAAVAYPSYVEYIRQARRADAQSALLELAQFMERRYTTTGSYEAGDDCSLPFDTSPRDGSSTFYNLSADCDASTFTLTATGTGSMAADECNVLTLTNTGLQDAASADCWRR